MTKRRSATRNGRNGNGHTAVKAAPAARVSAIVDDADPSARLPVLKTYKIFIGGKFPRTESGRYYVLKSPKGQPLANMCKCSRKDFRDWDSEDRWDRHTHKWGLRTSDPAGRDIRWRPTWRLQTGSNAECWVRCMREVNWGTTL